MKNQYITAEKNESRLTCAVRESINSMIEDHDGDRKATFRTLSRGCVSGVVLELLCHKDTTKFYDKHREEIQTMVCDRIVGPEGFMVELLPNWEVDDHFAQGAVNKNTLAWFAYDTIAAMFEAR